MRKLLLLFIVAVGFSCSDDELIDYTAQNEADIQAYLTENNINAEKTLSGLYYVIHSEGNGESPNFNSSVTLGYKGYFLNGTTFDSSTNATFGVNQVVPGFGEALTLLKASGSGTFILPSRLGYGNSGTRTGTIKGGDVIVFDINLISIN